MKSERAAGDLEEHESTRNVQDHATAVACEVLSGGISFKNEQQELTGGTRSNCPEVHVENWTPFDIVWGIFFVDLFDTF